MKRGLIVKRQSPSMVRSRFRVLRSQSKYPERTAGIDIALLQKFSGEEFDAEMIGAFCGFRYRNLADTPFPTAEELRFQ